VLEMLDLSYLKPSMVMIVRLGTISTEFLFSLCAFEMRDNSEQTKRSTISERQCINSEAP
jgi:hypothetical protein